MQVAHNWSDVVYLALLVILAIVNAFAHKKISGKASEAQAQADLVHVEVMDVKRATGVDKRATDTAPVPLPPEPPIKRIDGRRHTDHMTPDDAS